MPRLRLCSKTSPICASTRARRDAWSSVLALVLSASLLLRYAPENIADAFIATRLGGGWAGQFGELAADLDAGRIARRAVPETAAA